MTLQLQTQLRGESPGSGCVLSDKDQAVPGAGQEPTPARICELSMEPFECEHKTPTRSCAQPEFRDRVNERWPACRHAAIAKYFGDAPPACTKGCDHCQNPAAVRKQLDALEQSSSWSKTAIGPSQGNSFDPELYEGGRRGYGGFSRYDEGSEGSGDEGRDKAHKREWNLFYQKQMRLRKGKDPKIEEFVPPDADCPLKEASSRKIPRLTVKAREHCLGLLEEALSSNRQAAGSTDGSDLQAKAVAEIHKASKDGQLYDMGGGARSCSAQAEPPEPTEYDIRPASQVYSVSGVLVSTPNLGAEGASPSRDGAWGPLTAPKKCTGEEDGAMGRLAAHPQTEECSEDGPSACPLRDQRPPEGQPTPTKEAQRGKRPRPQQVLRGTRPWGKIPVYQAGSCQLLAPGIPLKEAANVVVKCLTPFYKEGKFASKELFKAFARHLSHSLTQNLSPGRSVKEEAQNVIKQLFHGRARCESEADWHGLCGPQR
ncbi:hypothetical protein E2I00_008363 [Balaenoptera physalus]|uniref:RecQ helicase-like 5 domain-containing protein n=1 Tax=Balaenoptera physalus TaxID=9770 RepID=A0A6A1PZY4_BALPH|nr:hypothetical protein E2I00_008363 [Balaenoptera physalus]